MADDAGKFSCGSCKRSYTWKKEIAGKRVRCKCGQVLTAPAESPKPPAPQTSDDDLYALTDLAADAQRAAANAPTMVVKAPAPGTTPKSRAPAAPRAAKAAAAPTAAVAAIPAAYQTGATVRERERAAANNVHFDPKRDYYVPFALLAVGIILYLGYYELRYGLSPAGLAACGLGLAILAVLESAFLFGFAMTVAGPLGVSFGSIGPAILKFVALAVFCDGATTWVDGMVAKYAAGVGNNIFGFGAVGFPVALGVYWGGFVYLFSMDPGDSWLVVVILAILYRIIRTLLMVLLLKAIMGFGGAATAISIPSFGSAPSASSPLIDEIEDAKQHQVLHEAKQYAADTSRTAEAPTIKAWYDAGAKTVWYETTRDINGKGGPFRFVIEMPDDKAARAKIYDVTKTYYKNNNMLSDPTEMQDTGDPYLLVDLP